jgi:protoporphyrinogen oxidase
MKPILIATCIAIGTMQGAHAQVLKKNAMEGDLWNSRRLIVFNVINLPKDEKKVFMETFAEFDDKLVEINKKMATLIIDYSRNGGRVSEKKANEFIERFFKIQEETHDLTKKYYRIFKKEYGAVVAARFVQTINVILYYHDARYVGRMPLFE